MEAPLPLPVTDPAAPRCGEPYTDWKADRWSCWLPPGHGGDHYSLDHNSWCWYSSVAR